MSRILPLLDDIEVRNQETAIQHAKIFGMYAAAMMTLTNQEREAIVGQSHDSVMQHFMTCTEHFLAQADYLNSNNLGALQALIMYLVRKSAQS